MDAGLHNETTSGPRRDAERGEVGRRASRSLGDGSRVALVHDWLTGLRGGEKCLDVLARELPKATLHTLVHERGTTTPAIESLRIKTSALQRLPGATRHYRQLLPVMPLAARGWRVGDVDLVVSLSHCVAKAVVPPAGWPHVCYCFTPMRYAWEGRDQYLETWHGPPGSKRLVSTMLDHLRAWDRATARRVSRFIAISETVRRRIRDCYGRDSVVIEPPVDTDYYTPIERPREDFYLVVSALVPYKKIEHAVAACTRLRRHLVVIGGGPERARLEQHAGPTIKFLGRQPDDVLRDHLRCCRALLFPGVEDFGIVPIEALACGAPVLALAQGGVAETVDNTVGALYEDASPAGLARAIELWEAAGRPHAADAGRQKALKFATSRFRDRILAFLNDVLDDASVTAPHWPRPRGATRFDAARNRGEA